MATAKSELQRLFEMVAQYVTKQKGAWEHDHWEALVEKVSKIGYEPNDEMKRNLGNMLESSKYFYYSMPEKPAKKKAAAKKKPAKKKGA